MVVIFIQMKINLRESVRPFKKVRHYVLAMLIMCFSFAFYYMPDPFTWQRFAVSFVWSASIWITQWAGHSYITHQIEKKYSWVKEPIKRLLIGIVALVIYTVISISIVHYVMYLIFVGRPPTFEELKYSALLAVIIAFVMVLMVSAVQFLREWRTSELKTEKMRSEMMAYKYESLRNQINPHFLFNSFNVLSDLVYDDQKLAVKFIHQLSDIYRYVLDSRDKELITLTEELDFIQSFVFLLKTRFEDNLSVKIDIEANENEMIVPMALQLLVENAVKHNEASRAKPLEVLVERSGDYITVSNNLQIKNVGDDSKKTGLQNIKQRFAFFSDKEVIIKEADGVFKVSIPILELTETNKIIES